MRILVEGKKPNAYPKRFKCVHCGSILEAESEDLRKIGTQYNSTVYEFLCPVCGTYRTTDADMFLKDDEVKA